ncbi:MAG: hypothetical protein HOP08_18405 [Cyclobacteriaceae bacterium]|nr:hypothetical protein [Cyclobacteriaceae bacterium]
MSYSGFLRFIGVLITVVFVVGFFLLFINSPGSFEKSDRLSIASYYLMGIDRGNLAIYLCYHILGGLLVIFCMGFLSIRAKQIQVFIAKVLLLFSGIQWLSFGIFPDKEVGEDLFLLRVIVFNLTCFLSFLILGVDFHSISRNKIATYYTIITAAGMLIIFLNGVFTLENRSFLFTNIHISMYFAWFGFFGVLNFLRSDNLNLSYVNRC